MITENKTLVYDDIFSENTENVREIGKLLDLAFEKRNEPFRRGPYSRGPPLGRGVVQEQPEKGERTLEWSERCPGSDM